MRPEEKLIRNAEIDSSKSMWMERNHHWTVDDTTLCKSAEKSGVLHSDSSQFLTFNELEILALEYEKIRVNLSVDNFLKEKGVVRRE